MDLKQKQAGQFKQTAGMLGVSHHNYQTLVGSNQTLLES